MLDAKYLPDNIPENIAEDIKKNNEEGREKYVSESLIFSLCLYQRIKED